MKITEHAQLVGCYSFEERPLDELDALIFSQLAYLPFEKCISDNESCTLIDVWHNFTRYNVSEELEPIRKNSYMLLCTCAPLKRYYNVILKDYVSILRKEIDMQFSATRFVLPGGDEIIAFRGTDTTIAGWKEDANMSYMNVVPAQEESTKYTQKILSGSNAPTYLCGHSKGGNLSLYAGTTVGEDCQAKLVNIFCFDGPGLTDKLESSEEYIRIIPKIISIIPQSSVVGLMLNYPPNYKVVKSKAHGLWQHDVFTWEISDGKINQKDEVGSMSKITDATLHSWLEERTDDERKFFVQTLNAVIDSMDASVVNDVFSDWKGSRKKIGDAIDMLPDESKEEMKFLFNDLFKRGMHETVKNFGEKFSMGKSEKASENETENCDASSEVGSETATEKSESEEKPKFNEVLKNSMKETVKSFGDKFSMGKPEKASENVSAEENETENC